MTTDLFNEDSLRDAIAGVWGEHGAHMDVFDHIVNCARRETNTRGVLDAYKAHHENNHPTCNISGPPAPPRPSQRPPALTPEVRKKRSMSRKWWQR